MKEIGEDPSLFIALNQS